MAALAAAIGGTALPPAPPAEQQLTEATAMEVIEQSNRKTADRTEVQQSGSMSTHSSFVHMPMSRLLSMPGSSPCPVQLVVGTEKEGVVQR